MDIKKEIIIGLVLVLLIILIYSGIEFWKNQNEQTDVTAFIIEDLKTKHPDASVGIISMEKIIDGNNSYYDVKAKVTEEFSSPCPVRIHYYYSYPEQNFITRPPEYITKNCKVCTVGTCQIAFEEEAIIGSHTLAGTEKIQEYIDGNKGAYPTVEQAENGWKVTWKSTSTEKGYSVILSIKGEILELKEI